MATATEQLRALAEEAREIHHRLTHLCLNPVREIERIMTALSDLQALGPRLDAVAAILPADVANAVAAQVAADAQAVNDAKSALATATQAATDAESALQAEVTDLTAKVVALETAAGIPAPAPAA